MKKATAYTARMCQGPWVMRLHTAVSVLRNRDVERLFTMVRVGDAVEIGAIAMRELHNCSEAMRTKRRWPQYKLLRGQRAMSV